MTNDKQFEDLISEKDFYILDENKNAIPATIYEWGRFREKKENKIVKQEKIDNYLISTVFVGLDSNFEWSGNSKPYKPHIFETMVFLGYSRQEEYCEHYSTYKQAEEGHLRAVQWVKNGHKDES